MAKIIKARLASLNTIDERQGFKNLASYFRLADEIDMDEGMVAYERYNMVMHRLSDKYRFSMPQVCAVFCSLSPNNDYWGNLRSAVSVLHGVHNAHSSDDIVVSTYNHCKLRAIEYARGRKDFETETKGRKILNFYHNILEPRSRQWVTIDGHMVGIWLDDKKATMRELLIRPSYYDTIAHNVKDLAHQNFILPQQMQAILWFVRKRLGNVVYDPQLDLFAEAGDAWKTARDIETIKPYRKAEERAMQSRLHEQQQEFGYGE